MTGGGPRYEVVEGRPLPADLLLPQRKERIEEVLAARTRSVTVVLDRLEDSFNMAAVLRTCEGMGLQEVHVIRNPDAPFAPNSRVTQGCDKWLDLHLHRDAAGCFQRLHARGYRVLASAVTPRATSLFELRFDQRMALVFGNERTGVSDEVLAHADGTFWIPMRGFSRSMNISAAASACVTRAVAWRLEHLGQAGDLADDDRAQLREHFSLLSVKQRGRVYRNR
jgi:tRNA (guanosine-2'-O-)-methyltransferase